jgi:futalosine hydrolase
MQAAIPSRDGVRSVLLVVAATVRELGGLDGLVCGVGPVEAAVHTARALAERPPGAVLHVGLAGCRRGCGLAPPALVIGAEAVYDDVVVPLAPRRALPDARLVEAARRVLPDAPVLPIGTSGTVGGTRGHDVEAMEGYAVLRACALAGVPAVEVRAIANEIEEEDRALWLFEDALGALAQSLPVLVDSMTAAMSPSP